MNLVKGNLVTNGAQWKGSPFPSIKFTFPRVSSVLLHTSLVSLEWFTYHSGLSLYNNPDYSLPSPCCIFYSLCLPFYCSFYFWRWRKFSTHFLRKKADRQFFFWDVAFLNVCILLSNLTENCLAIEFYVGNYFLSKLRCFSTASSTWDCYWAVWSHSDSDLL